ncbi:uncharacterized protein LOC112551340 [Alligator sinensis]|uniref:Uncharacterized protein LOC112551340 n=1 Tax=Alligator sinensis TaxID=38654 RepID=A0A3Q0H691_ALLSI|nr:uncharacterized protein LOC112551340 [Alligator sinensis]
MAGKNSITEPPMLQLLCALLHSSPCSDPSPFPNQLERQHLYNHISKRDRASSGVRHPQEGRQLLAGQQGAATPRHWQLCPHLQLPAALWPRAPSPPGSLLHSRPEQNLMKTHPAMSQVTIGASWHRPSTPADGAKQPASSARVISLALGSASRHSASWEGAGSCLPASLASNSIADCLGRAALYCIYQAAQGQASSTLYSHRKAPRLGALQRSPMLLGKAGPWASAPNETRALALSLPGCALQPRVCCSSSLISQLPLPTPNYALLHQCCPPGQVHSTCCPIPWAHCTDPLSRADGGITHPLRGCLASGSP